VETTGQAAWDQRYSGPDLVWGAGPNRFATGEVTALAAGRAVDLGTGEGRNAIWLAERGWQVTAVDFSAAGLARAGRLAAERGVSVDWVQADLLDYQPAPGGYDLVLVAYIHLPSASLARVFRAAARGGRGGRHPAGDRARPRQHHPRARRTAGPRPALHPGGGHRGTGRPCRPPGGTGHAARADV
jgi:SAM-dependent methyltransferase